MDNKILNLAFQDREAFELLRKYISEEEFDGQAKILYKAVEEFYSTDPDATHCDKDIILGRIERLHPKHIDIFKIIINNFKEVSTPNLLKEILELKKQNVAYELSGALLASNDGAVESLIEEYQGLQDGLLDEDSDGDTELFIDEPVSSIVEAFSEQNLIKIYPNSLNELAGGGVPAQTHIVLYAEPELGKSLISINMAAGFCRDGRRTLFIENEDASKATLLRFINRMSGMDRYEVLANPTLAHERALEKGYGNLVFKSMSPGTIPEIESLIREYDIECLIVNQIRHLEFKGIDGDTAQLTAAGRAMRKLIKKYNLVGVSVTQAADSATNKLVLERGDVYMSNTSLPGDADILLGIGGNDEFKSMGRRMLSLVKNKPGNNHSHFPVLVDEKLSKVISI
jgi:archaellum biogenesis ATPase FlaH